MGLLAEEQTRPRDNVWRRLRRQLKPTPSTSVVSESILFPEPWQCITHLKLMRAFARLRHDFIDEFVQPETHTDHDMSHICQEEWGLYLDQAAVRFEAWWTNLSGKAKTSVRYRVDVSTWQESGKLEAIICDTKPMVWTEENLPPLDVLMLLHSFMLNPRCFLEDCIRHNMLPLWKAGMPWHLLDNVFDASPNPYDVEASAEKTWTKTTGHPWDIRQSRLKQTRRCRICGKDTKWQLSANSTSATTTKDPKNKTTLYYPCAQCSKTTLDTLKLSKLRSAIEALCNHSIPLPGTMLTTDGLAQSTSKPGVDPDLFSLNRLLQDPPGTNILNLTHTANRHPDATTQLHEIKLLIQNTPEYQTNPHLKTSLHRLLQRISEAPSPYTLALPAAVTRQTLFINTMQEIDWLHSPAVEHTMTDLLARYRVFFKIMEQNKTNVAVPTYAVDLAWHTHQLSPASYYTFSLANAGNVFIDHDDRIEEGTRNDAFEFTTERYAELSGGRDYSACLCWYCATTQELNNDKSQPLDISPSGHVDLTTRPDLEKQVLSKIAASQHQKLEDDYGLACRAARRRTETVPDQKAFLDAYKWAYPDAKPVLG